MRPKYARSRWNATPVVRPVVNTDGELLRKVEMRAAVFAQTGGFGSATKLDFRTGATLDRGRVTGGKFTRPTVYYRDGRRDAECLCREAGSLRCPVSGHEHRGVMPPKAWPYDAPWDDTVGVRPPKETRDVVEHADGSRLIRRKR